VVFGKSAVHAREVKGSDYRGLLVEVVKFFRGGEPPVPLEVTVEMMGFLEAASKARAGAEVPLPGGK
jgi:hypothetical protein